MKIVHKKKIVGRLLFAKNANSAIRQLDSVTCILSTLIYCRLLSVNSRQDAIIGPVQAFEEWRILVNSSVNLSVASYLTEPSVRKVWIRDWDRKLPFLSPKISSRNLVITDQTVDRKKRLFFQNLLKRPAIVIWH